MTTQKKEIKKMPEVKKAKPKKISGFIGENASKSSLKINGKEVAGAILLYVTDEAISTSCIGKNAVTIKGLAWESFLNHPLFRDIRRTLKIED